MRLPDFAVHYSAHAGVALVVPESSAEKKVLHITCPVCGTVVPGLYKLQRHKMKHDPELKYKCPACPKQFVKANTLRMHITNVHKSSKGGKTVVSGGEDRVPCELCGELFPSQQALKHHSLSHLKAQCKTEDSKLEAEAGQGRECPECRKQLASDCPGLAEHFAAEHPGEQQRFQCSDCDPVVGVRLLSLAGARQHYRQAHPGRPHTCWVCREASFGRAEALHSHLASQHRQEVGEPGPGPLPCLHCPATFPTHMERVVHTRHAHMVDTIDITSTDLDEVGLR